MLWQDKQQHFLGSTNYRFNETGTALNQLLGQVSMIFLDSLSSSATLAQLVELAQQPYNRSMPSGGSNDKRVLLGVGEVISGHLAGLLVQLQDE